MTPSRADRPFLGESIPFDLLVEAVEDYAIFMLDPTGRIVSWNRGAALIKGYAADEVLGEHFSIFYTSTDLERGHPEHELKVAERDGRFEEAGWRVKKDGTRFWANVVITAVRDEDGTLLGFGKVTRNLDEEKRGERRSAAQYAVTRVLAESHTLEEAAPRLLAAMGEALGWDVGAFWVLDEPRTALRPIGFWSAPSMNATPFVEASRGSSFPRGAGLPGRVWEKMEPEWIPDVESDRELPRASAAASEGLHGAFGFPIVLGTELLGVVEFFNHEILEPDATLLRTAEVIGTDIAQSIKRVRAEEEAERMRCEVERINDHLQIINAELADRSREAESASRAKSEFLANMSHELRTPINAITGYTDLLLMEVTGSITEDQRKQLERIKTSSHHLVALVSEVLDLAKIEAGRSDVRRNRVRVGDPIETARTLIIPQAEEKGVTLGEQCEGEVDLELIADADRIRQIVVNLLSNAVKFTDPGGHITIRCERVETGADVVESEAESWLSIHVEDNGMGVPPDKLDTIFEPFEQGESGTTRSWGGTGLGLAIARRFARLMNGDVTVRSEPGEGSCFTLTLPLTTEE